MKYYVYATPQGLPEILRAPLSPEHPQAGQYTLTAESDTRPDVYGKRWNGSAWIDDRPPPPAAEMRCAKYPSVQAQLDALWAAIKELNGGQVPAAARAVRACMDRIDCEHPLPPPSN